MTVVKNGDARLDVPIRVSARTDYAIRATAELAASENAGLVKAERLAEAQDIPLKFLLNILTELRRAGILHSHRGSDGGYRLARPADEISVADIILAVEGTMSSVQDVRLVEAVYAGAARRLKDVWLAAEATLNSVLESVSLADLAEGTLPARVTKLAAAASSNGV